MFLWCCHIALCVSFVDSFVSFCQFHFFRFYYHLIVHTSSYCIVYDMYVMPFGIIKNNNSTVPVDR